jgi:hypothetical protein
VYRRLLALVLVSLVLASAGCRFVARITRSVLLREEIITSAVSPDQRYIATAFQHSWGPPPKHATYVSIRPSSSAFKTKTSDFDAVFEVEGPRAVGVLWDTSSQLRIVCVGCGRDSVVRHDTRWQDVAVSVDRYGAAQ